MRCGTAGTACCAWTTACWAARTWHPLMWRASQVRQPSHWLQHIACLPHAGTGSLHPDLPSCPPPCTLQSTPLSTCSRRRCCSAPTAPAPCMWGWALALPSRACSAWGWPQVGGSPLTLALCQPSTGHPLPKARTQLHRDSSSLPALTLAPLLQTRLSCTPRCSPQLSSTLGCAPGLAAGGRCWGTLQLWCRGWPGGREQHWQAAGVAVAATMTLSCMISLGGLTLPYLSSLPVCFHLSGAGASFSCAGPLHCPSPLDSPPSPP